MQQAFFEGKRSDVVVGATFRMSESFVDKVDGNVFGTEVPMYRLQTGDVSDEGGSGQAPEHKDGIFAFDAAERELVPIRVKDCDIRHLLTECQAAPFES
ncbi:MAG: hypothetical protein ACI8P0_001720 [Planctomycetaceae bacterium]|jgi:hypothetical protein